MDEDQLSWHNSYKFEDSNLFKEIGHDLKLLLMQQYAVKLIGV